MQASKKQNKREERILVLAPTGRDAELTARFLGEAGLTSKICGSLGELCREISENAGAVFLTGEALEPENVSILTFTLHNQPPWSDIPIIVLTSGGGENPANADTLAELSEAGNVTLIERPVRLMTLGSAIKSALRARRKQYEARDFLLAEIESKEELRRSEEQLRDARHRLESTLAAAEVGTWTWDCVNNKLFADKNLARMFSVSDEDASGGALEKYLQAVHPEDLERVGQILEKAIQHGTEFQAEYRLVSPDGEICWVIARGIVERDSEGRAVSLPGVVVDITERRQIEEALRESDARLRLAIDISRTSTFDIDLQTDEVQTDAIGREIYGWSADMPLTFSRVQSHFHPDDREEVSRRVSDALAPTGSDEFEVEQRIIRTDGRTRWIRVRGRAFFSGEGEQRAAVRCLGTYIDITDSKRAEEALRESEERYRNLFNSIDEGFCVIEVIFDENDKAVDYRFLEVNPTFQQQTGLENALGRRMRELAPDHEEYWFETYGKVALTGEAIRFESGAKALNRWFDFYAFRIGNSASRKVAVLFKDITERKREEAERESLLKSAQQARRTAEEASRLKDEFLAIVSHELRTPLNSILGWTQMFRRQPFDNAIIERAFETIERNARAQNQLIEDLLDVSRIISGKVRLDIQPVKLTKVIEAALDSVRPAADAREISLQTTLDENIEPVSGDPDRLQQIIWNLLSNAIKFTPKGGKVEMRLEQKNSHVEIIVADTGRGIEKDFLPFVFDRFRQADSSSKRQYGGLGLGLSIVRQLAELHGGSVAVFSEGEGKGATFTVVLPRTGSIRQPEYQKTPHADKNGFSNGAMNLAGTKVLLVDDDEDTRILLSMLLEQSSAAVKAAASVSEALSFLETDAFDLLISDIEMPQQDGYDLIKFVRAMPQKRNLPAIAVTAYARNEDRLRAIAAGYDMHVSKPVESGELLTIIESLVRRKS
ncbi:MAG TPA: PAS domain-containing protein [Pyrinomonadaceae bacterium]|jgi:PAS domain S-box-containing protein